MQIKKKWKVWTTSLIAVALGASSLTILFWPTNVSAPMSTYLLQFDKQRDSAAVQKNAYINELQDNMRKVLNEYKTYHKNTYKSEFTGVDLKYANLNSAQPTGELNYFDSLNRTMKAIDPLLGFNNQQRTPQIVNDAFYNKNTELLSFYWSPDYNSVGTWVKYMFTDIYTLPNLWSSTYQILENHIDKFIWANSLKTFITDFNIPGTTIPVYKSPIEILSWIASSDNPGVNMDDYYVTLANIIGAWIKTYSDVTINKTAAGENIYSDVDLGIAYVDWMASQNPNIPFAEIGPESKIPYLVTYGLYNPVNPNIDTNYRDWYIRPSQIGSQTNIKLWDRNDPFTSTKTPWNPAFSMAPNTLFASQNWTGLTSWTTNGDENDKLNPDAPTRLVSDGAYDNILDPNIKAALENEFRDDQSITLKIRPTSWVDTNGQQLKNESNDNYYLSPHDFWAGIKAFQRSLESGINSNNAYFVGLINIDLKKTIDHAANLQRNTSPTDTKEFKIFFNDPILTLDDTLDILQKQYFFALPAFKEKVQNIVNDAKYNSVTRFVPGTTRIDQSNQDFTVYYGCGDGKRSEVWSDLAFAAPYYINSINEQKIIHKINPLYFTSFDNVKEIDEYMNFNMEKDGMKRIPQIDLNYGGSYSVNITYEQFKTKEIDVSEIQSANLVTTLATYAKNIKYVTTKKLNRSNIVSINLQIYEKWTENPADVPQGFYKAENIIIDDATGQPMWNPETREPLYSLDEWGNYVFPAGKSPKLKTQISRAYADLFVKDYYTPGGTSETLRYGLMNSINWVSLKSLYTPGVTQSIQYSFMPYGVYTFNDPQGEYWDYAANKRYLSNTELASWNDELIAKRRSGNMIWTYDELRSGMIK